MTLTVSSVLADPAVNKYPEIYVSVSGDDRYNGSSEYPVKSIGRAAEIASDGGVIYLAPGVYDSENDRGILLRNRTSFIGAGPDKTIIDGMQKDLLFHTRNFAPMLFDNLTLTGGTSKSGGAVYIEYGDVRFTNTIIRNNSAGSGGGVSISVGDAIFENSRITGNSAAGGGGGVEISGSSSATFIHTELTENSAGSGGGIYLGNKKSTVSLIRSKIINNRAKSNGGGILVQSGKADISCSVLSDNTAGFGGGAVAMSYQSTARITSSKIVNNTAAVWDGGIMTETGQSVLIAINNIFYNRVNVQGYQPRGGGRGIYMDKIGGGAFSMDRLPVTSITGTRYSGGNAWGNPDGRGFSQTCHDADEDGICDQSYWVISGLKDKHPLVFNEMTYQAGMNSSLPCDTDSVPENIPVHILTQKELYFARYEGPAPVPPVVPVAGLVIALCIIAWKKKLR